jgi:hypothetical protein
LLTNFHVVKNAKRGIIEFVERDGEKPGKGKRIRVEIEGKDLISFTDEPNDLAAIPIAPIMNQLETAGNGVFIRSITPELIATDETLSQLSAIEEIIFIGYPSGLYDDHNLTPIVRKGITASPIWNDFQGKPVFLIDAGVFPGSSGSPVFIMNQGGFGSSNGFAIGNRLIFLGMISESILRVDGTSPSVFLGLGKVIKSKTIKNFLETLLTKFKGAK